MIKAIVIAMIIENGARTNMRRIIMYAFWIFVTSVVSLVTRPDGENLSILAKEKVCTLRNIALRRFFAKPVAAFAPSTPPMMPANSPISANTSMIAPVLMMTGMLLFAMPSSTIRAMSSGISVSTRTSRTMNSGVAIDALLYSLISPARILITSIGMTPLLLPVIPRHLF